MLYDFWVTPETQNNLSIKQNYRRHQREFSLSFVSPARQEAITLIVFNSFGQNKQAKVTTYRIHDAPMFLPESFLIIQHFRQNTKFSSGLPKLEFGSSREMFDVWPGPNS